MDPEITNGSTSNGDPTGSGMSGEVRTALRFSGVKQRFQKTLVESVVYCI